MIMMNYFSYMKIIFIMKILFYHNIMEDNLIT